MRRYRIVAVAAGGGSTLSRTVDADRFEVTRSGALVFHRLPHNITPFSAVEAYAGGQWLSVGEVES